jgi:hypothetical protein
MNGPMSRRKHYVQVVSSTDAEGRIMPLVVVWDDGTRYKVDRILDRRQAYSPRTGGTGMRYTVCVGGRATFLYYEGPRWFVEAKC